MDERMANIISGANLTGEDIIASFASFSLDDDTLGTLHPGVQAGIKQLAEGQGFSPTTALYGPGYHASDLFEFVGGFTAMRSSVSCPDSGHLLDCYTIVHGDQAVAKVYVRTDDIESTTRRRQVETLIGTASENTGSVGDSHGEQHTMSFAEFTQLRSQGLIQAGIEEGTAVRLMDHLPTNFRMAHHFWTWIWFLSIPGFIYVGVVTQWWIGLLLLALVTPMISGGIKKSAGQFVLQHAEEDPEFFELLVNANVLEFENLQDNPGYRSAA